MGFPFRIPGEGEVLIGHPTKPDRPLARALAELLGAFPEVQEAQCFAPGKMTSPAQVLMVVFSGPHDAQEVMPRIREGVARLLRRGASVDVWPITTRGFLESVRGARCKILGRVYSGKAVTEDPWSPWDRALHFLRRHSDPD
jgi:hypothetical protein